MQAPPEHVSDIVESHARHDEPAVPHDPKAAVVQVWPEQQPVGHDVASHTHCPPRHRCPLPHAAWPPQVQAPAVQPSATLLSQTVHAAPPVPHATAEGVVQAVPEQHPVEHEEGSHDGAST